MIDTGALTTCFDKATAEKAGLPIIGSGRMSSATHVDIEVPLFSGILVRGNLKSARS